jgi:putative addiction module component (TIGR02574 family)
MSAALAEIEQEAMALPPNQRAQLADRLWESLASTSSSPLTEGWTAEIERRRQEVAEGSAKPVSGEEVSRKAWQLAASAGT